MSGQGVRASVIKHYPPLRNLKREQRQEIRKRLQEREVLQKKSGKKKDLEEKLQVLNARETSSKTKIEHYQKSRNNLGSGSCPFFKEPCPKITGDASELFLEEEKDLRVEIKRIWSERAEINVRLNTSIEAEKALQNLNILVEREKALEESIEKINRENPGFNQLLWIVRM